MAKFSRLEVYQKMAAHPVVPLLYHSDAEACKQILQACYNGGIRVFEFTNRGEFAHEIFAELVKYARKNCPDLAMGVGTMLDAGTVSLYLQLGADFVVTPNLVEEIAKVCNRRKIPWIPGVATMTEITKAEELGAEVIKIFPGQVMGPGFVKALKGPLPWTSVMATGGVEPTVESLTKWFEAGVTCVGLGSQLFPKKVLEGGDYASLEAQIREVMSIVATLRKK
ncbi:MAG: bifunctional 4-hydroxy-2-oxoglutarate aldolase/2-dehydro-3-deoxy-phosphogluconate aldolase [Spirosomataceae bacterium]